MPIAALENYVRYLPAQQATFQLLIADAFAMANAEDGQRKRLYNDLRRLANDGMTVAKSLPTQGNLAKIGIAMKVVSATK